MDTVELFHCGGIILERGQRQRYCREEVTRYQIDIMYPSYCATIGRHLDAATYYAYVNYTLHLY